MVAEVKIDNSSRGKPNERREKCQKQFWHASEDLVHNCLDYVQLRSSGY